MFQIMVPIRIFRSLSRSSREHQNFETMKEKTEMPIPAHMWLKDDGGADIRGSSNIQNRIVKAASSLLALRTQ
ncbi:hypothetical protein [Burkholderia glumae]|uniref:hypothetical protein n=1 Tax=Burkholderia glumae TaxID=337 RepID=UPI0022A75B16|nr:hypothetical protein [Burkholderia glumae]